MLTESISYDVAGTTYVGYLATKPGSVRRPGVLVCHEASGLHAEMKNRCHRLAELGYVVFAVDYVGGGAVLETKEEVLAKLGPLRGDVEHVRVLARAGLDQLLARPEVDPARVAATGYCFGGTFALELARSGAALACVVGFHSGLATTRPEDAKQIRGKILVCIGAEDPLIPPEQRLAFEQEMRAANVDWRMNVYGNAVHNFTNPDADRSGNPASKYHQPSDERSWRAMRDLFDETF